jgi:hypothetical protein
MWRQKRRYAIESVRILYEPVKGDNCFALASVVEIVKPQASNVYKGVLVMDFTHGTIRATALWPNF